MKMPHLFPRKKMRATTARRSIGLPHEADYEEMSEPNMKLSRALLIVLVLHVVAVAGIVAFNTIKTRQGNVTAPYAGPAASAAPIAKKSMTATPASSASAAKHESKPTHAPEKIIAKIGPKTDGAKPAEKASAVSVPARGKITYVVEKGDTPLKVAKKFKVPFDDLMAVNHIDDPHTLKIGQKLIIPAKAPPKAKKVED